MKREKYNRLIALLCSTCGNSQFEFQENDLENEIIRCPSCGRQMKKEELICENKENIEANVEEVKKEVVKDIKKEISDIFKKSFNISKKIRIK